MTSGILACLIKKLSALQYAVHIQKKPRLRTTSDIFIFSRGFLGVGYTA